MQSICPAGFAQKYLFGPMDTARTDWAWNYDLTNTDKEYSQIHLRPRDMLKLGILFEDSGRWHGRQIIPESWVKTSMAEHIHVDNVSYGYFWWRHMFNVEMPGGAKQVVVLPRRATAGKRSTLRPSTIWSLFLPAAATTPTPRLQTQSWKSSFFPDRCKP